MDTWEGWEESQFGGTELGDKRRTRRLVAMSGQIARQAGESLPRQLGGRGSALSGAYRFLSNAAIKPAGMQSGHRGEVVAACRQQAVVLCVQDTTELDFTGRQTRGLGQIGDGGGQGLEQHTALAVVPGGGVLGILHQHLYIRPERRQGETRRQRQARWTEAMVWADAARAVHGLELGAAQVVHVGDRAADQFDFLHCCRQLGQGHVIRAKSDRKAQAEQRLWAWLSQQALGFSEAIEVPARQAGKRPSGHRQAKIAVRYAPITVPPPVNDPRAADCAPLELWAVHLLEENPPAGFEPVEWMLLSSLAVTGAAQARVVIDYYRQRWQIEEWHRCLKQGCALESAQLKTGTALGNLAALLGVVAVRLLQLRDLARQPQAAQALAKDHLPALQVKVAAHLAQRDPHHLTVQEFWRQIAKLGGWLGRKNDPPPGWLALWKGWRHFDLLTQGATLFSSPPGNV